MVEEVVDKGAPLAPIDLVAEANRSGTSGRIEVCGSIAVEIAKVLVRLSRPWAYPASDWVKGISSAKLKKVTAMAASFWSDQVGGFEEILILADWAGVFMQMDVELCINGILLASGEPHAEPRMSSEMPAERGVYRQRLAALRADPALRRRFGRLLRMAWSIAEPVWQAAGGEDAVRLAVVDWKRILEEERVPLIEALPSSHLTFQLGLRPLVDRAVEFGTVVVSPNFFAGGGSVSDLPSFVCIGVRTSPGDALNDRKVLAGHVVNGASVLADSSRVLVLREVLAGSASARSIAARLHLDLRAVQRNLRRLVSAGLVTVRPSCGAPIYESRRSSVEHHLDQISAKLTRSYRRGAQTEGNSLLGQASFEAIFRDSPIAIVQLALDGACLACNEAAYGLFGVTPTELPHLSIQHLLSMQSDGLRLIQHLSNATGRPQFAEKVDIRTRAGPLVPARITVSTVSGSDGVPLFAYLMAEDIRQRQRAEAAEREAEVSRRESEAMSRFVATMSHELRTPLNAVLGFAQLLDGQRFGDLNDRQLRYVAHIVTAGGNLLGLVNQILDISKMDAGLMPTMRDQVNISELVRAVVAELMPIATKKGVTMTATAGQDVIAIVDAWAIRQILTNLIGNAVKFTSVGGVEIAVRRTGVCCEVAVTDSGAGIDSSEFSNIFKEFVQLDRGRNRSQDGAGLGLALCRRLAKLIGATISVRSIVAKGSSFTLLIPDQRSSDHSVTDNLGERLAVRESPS